MTPRQLAEAAGYRVHQGADEDPPELRGRWWWSWSDNGCGIDNQVDECATEAQAWDSAILAHANELMEP